MSRTKLLQVRFEVWYMISGEGGKKPKKIHKSYPIDLITKVLLKKFNWFCLEILPAGYFKQLTAEAGNARIDLPTEPSSPVLGFIMNAEQTLLGSKCLGLK